MVVKKPGEDQAPKKMDQKEKKGWFFSVTFLLIVICLIMFLAYTPLNGDNRDIIVGIIGTITGSIASMIAIASGRDPSEVDDLKSKLAKSDGDRQALISRLRDSQIQLQLARTQIFELQNAIIEELSIFKGKQPVKTKNERDVVLPDIVDEWTPKR